MDAYLFRRGNPFLKPQFTHGMELKYGLNKKIFASIGADFIRDFVLSLLQIVDNQTIDEPKRLAKGIRRILDPEVHCVTDNERRTVNLIDDALLDRRVEIAEAYDLTASEARRKCRVELLQHVQIGSECIPLVQVIVVAACPGEA